MAENPVETSGVRCEEPRKLHKKKMATLKPEQLKCKSENLNYNTLNSCCLIIYFSHQNTNQATKSNYKINHEKIESSNTLNSRESELYRAFGRLWV